MSFKSLTQIQKQNFSKTICVLAGGPHMDLNGSKIINTIKESSPDTKFIGIGGELMKEAGLTSYADVNKFLNKPLHPYKNFKHQHIERPVHPVFGFYHHANRKVRNEIDKTSLFKDILEQKPDAFICLQNDFFMNRFYNFIADLYDANNLVKPPLFHFDRTHINQRQEFTEWLDYQFSVNPTKPVNWGKYTFPSTVVGHEGVGRAWQYLYRKNKEFEQLTSDNHIYLSPENNKNIIEKLVAEERVRFRQSAGLSESQHLIFFAPGDVKKEIDFSVKALKNGLPEYLNRPEVKNLDQSHFVLVVSLPQNDTAGYIEQSVKELNLPVAQIFTTDKYSAISGSDCGLVHNGEMVSECAALQLPVAILEHMPFAQAYFMQMYNHWNNELNIANCGETQQELICTTATPYRISEELAAMSDPKFRYYVAGRFEQVLYDMVPKSDSNEKAVVTQGDQTFVKHTFTNQFMANKILNAAEVYNKADKNIPHYKINPFRKELIQGVL